MIDAKSLRIGNWVKCNDLELQVSGIGQNHFTATHKGHNPKQSNESLETLAEFERLTDNQLRNWLGDFIQLPPDRRAIIGDPSEININKFF